MSFLGLFKTETEQNNQEWLSFKAQLTKNEQEWIELDKKAEECFANAFTNIIEVATGIVGAGNRLQIRNGFTVLKQSSPKFKDLFNAERDSGVLKMRNSEKCPVTYAYVNIENKKVKEAATALLDRVYQNALKPVTLGGIYTADQTYGDEEIRFPEYYAILEEIEKDIQKIISLGDTQLNKALQTVIVPKISNAKSLITSGLKYTAQLKKLERERHDVFDRKLAQMMKLHLDNTQLKNSQWNGEELKILPKIFNAMREAMEAIQDYSEREKTWDYSKGTWIKGQEEYTRIGSMTSKPGAPKAVPLKTRKAINDLTNLSIKQIDMLLDYIYRESYSQISGTRYIEITSKAGQDIKQLEQHLVNIKQLGVERADILLQNLQYVKMVLSDIKTKIETIEKQKVWKQRKEAIAYKLSDIGETTCLILTQPLLYVVIAYAVVTMGPDINKAMMNKAIENIKDPKQKEIVMAVKKMRDSKTLTLTQVQVINEISEQCADELTQAIKIFSNKKYDVKTDRVIALQHIINAKGLMQQLKELKVPVDLLLSQIKQVEQMLYQNTGTTSGSATSAK